MYNPSDPLSRRLSLLHSRDFTNTFNRSNGRRKLRNSNVSWSNVLCHKMGILVEAAT